MKMNRETIIFALALTAISASVTAADVDKEVEVTRAYVPEIKTATKLHLSPDMSDDGYIKPDIDYSITPISIKTKMEIEPYSPVSVNLEEYEPSKRYYTKLGIGAPLQSVVDVYATPISTRQGYVVGYFNQDGRYSNIENDYGEKNNSIQNHMRGGVAAGRHFGNRTLEGSVDYNHDMWSRYATDVQNDKHPLYQSVEFDGRFGDNFVDLSTFNFAIDASAEHFWSRSDYKSNDFGVSLLMGRKLIGGNVLLGGGYNNISGDAAYLNHAFNIMASYGYSGGFWAFKLGLKFFNDKVSYDAYDAKYVAVPINISDLDGNSNVGRYVVPDVELSYQINNTKIVGYIKSNGELLHHDFATLSETNPYLTPGLFATQNGVKYDADLGLKGAMSSGRFGYNIFAEYSAIKNRLYWAYMESSVGTKTDNEFVANYSSQNCYSFNAELEYLPTSNLLFSADLKVAKYDNDKKQVLEDGEAKTQLQLEAKYKVGSWRFGLNGDLLSRRKFSCIGNDGGWTSYKTQEIPTTFDLGMSVDYKLKNSMILFVEADNLINDDLYKWIGYREYGINAMAGIKMEF